MIDWHKVGDSLPDPNKRVVALLEGFCEHSGVSWVRGGYAFMVRHPDAQDSMPDGWARRFYEDAVNALDADVLIVTHWSELNAPEQ